MLEGVIGNNVKELPQCTAKTKLLYGIWFLWNHTRELFLCAVHTREWMNRKETATLLPLKHTFSVSLRPPPANKYFYSFTIISTQLL